MTVRLLSLQAPRVKSKRTLVDRRGNLKYKQSISISVAIAHLSPRMTLIRPQFLAEIGVALVLIAALGAVVASATSIAAYFAESGSGCSTITWQIQSNVALWSPTVSFLAIDAAVLASGAKFCPQLCRIGPVVTLICAGAALVVVGIP